MVSSFVYKISLVSILLTLIVIIPQVEAADKDAWRRRSIYQLLTDRFAPPSANSPALTAGIPSDGSAPCPKGTQQWCGGTWRSIIEKLDYIQGMGLDSVWISPASRNIEEQTAYGVGYHGFWVQDPTRLNPRFGDASDLKALSDALHERDMYLMVDIVVNNVVVNPQDSIEQMIEKNPDVLYRKPEHFHPKCGIDWSNQTSVENCWLGDDKLPLPDLNTQSDEVQKILLDYIKTFVQEYSIDGLRIDAAKHVQLDFWQPFCASAGVFCIGEVYGDDLAFASQFQSLNYMDSVLNFPLYYGMSAAFFGAGGAPLNMSHLVDVYSQIQQQFPDPGVLGNFLGNHDVPRYHDLQVDPRTSWNALVFQFLSDGIPTVFYGDEQDINLGDKSGYGDPFNRPGLWVEGNGDYNTDASTYQNIKRLNEIRSWLVKSDAKYNGKTFLDSKLDIIATSDQDLAFRKGPAMVVVNNRGSPESSPNFAILGTGFDGAAIDVLGCSTMPTGANTSLSISHSMGGTGGLPRVFFTRDDAAQSGLCPNLFRNASESTQSHARERGAALVTASPVVAVSVIVSGLVGALMSL